MRRSVDPATDMEFQKQRDALLRAARSCRAALGDLSVSILKVEAQRSRYPHIDDVSRPILCLLVISR